MVTSILQFEATPDADGELIHLQEVKRSRIPLHEPSATPLPFDQWVLASPAVARPAVARLIRALEDGEATESGQPFVQVLNGGARLHAQYVAQLPEPDALSLGLPPAARLSLNLQSQGVPHQPEFRVVTRWTRPNGLPTPVQLCGSRIRHDGKDWRVPEPIWSVLRATERLNGTADQSQRQAALAALRSAIGDEDRLHVRPDGFIERLRLTYAAGFSLDLQPTSAGFDFDPILFSPERLREAEEGQILDAESDGLLPPTQQAAFARRFKQGDGSRRAYLLDDGAILFLDPTLQKALSVVKRAQSLGAEARREFARNPQRRISETLAEGGLDASAAAALFVETQQFSERVSGIDIWRKPVLPWIKPKPNSWLPEAFGLRIGDPPDAETIEMPVERIEEALAAVEIALETERPTFVFDGKEIPATEQARSALSNLAELFRASAMETRSERPPASLAERYFLQVRDNLEDVAYAPLVSTEAARAAAPPAFPSAIRSEPKPHQVEGFEWLVACWRSNMPGALLADDMGLGKTFQALAFLAWLRHEHQTSKPVLIVAPTGLLANWRAEIAMHVEANALGAVVNAYGDSLRRMRDTVGRDIEVGKAGIDPDVWDHAGIVLTTFETMRDYHLSFARQPFAAIIYDEAQKLKNPASQMTRAAKTLHARFQLAMTGTPVENRLQDLWSIYDVIRPGLLGSSKAFEGAYPARDAEKLRELHDLLAKPEGKRPPLLMRRMKDDCLPGLPAKHIRPLPVQMPATQAAAYHRVIERAFAARGSGKRGYMLEILHMLRGVSLHPHAPEMATESYFAESARLQAAFAILDAIEATGEKALLFCESLAMQALLALEIKRRYRLGHEVARIHGGVQSDARLAAVNTFQARGPGFDVMILSPKAGGVGLTLTAANHVIHLSRWWNPAVEDQATDRVFRIGQTKDVFVYLPQAVHPDPAIGPTSFDLKLDGLMKRKRELSRGLLLPGEDEGDIDTLFESILGGNRAEAADGTTVKAEPLAGAGQGTAAPQTPSGSRPTLGLRPPAGIAEQPRPTRSARAVYRPRMPRDLSIFQRPVSGERIIELQIRDPYGCSDERNRQALVDLVTEIHSSATSIGEAVVVVFDAESVERRQLESSVYQRDDLEQRWREKFQREPGLRIIQLSRRQSRSFHDRSITAATASGRKIIWDISNGVDGVMLPNKECTVHLTVESMA